MRVLLRVEYLNNKLTNFNYISQIDSTNLFAYARFFSTEIEMFNLQYHRY